MPKNHLLPDYEYGSPRYHAVKPDFFEFLDEDYVDYDATNGTYDYFWPCYILTDTGTPEVRLVKPSGQETTVIGDLGLKKVAEGTNNITFGGPRGRGVFVNSNLQDREVDFVNWCHVKINPGWSLIYTYGSVEDDFVGFLIRGLGNSTTIEDYHALDLDDIGNNIPIEAFPAGVIVKYKEGIYRAEVETKVYPPGNGWTDMSGKTNVFNADCFLLSSDGQTKYLGEIREFRREFNPAATGFETTLVSWNVSAAYG